jgi:hypothetical protein
MSLSERAFLPRVPGLGRVELPQIVAASEVSAAVGEPKRESLLRRDESIICGSVTTNRSLPR